MIEKLRLTYNIFFGYKIDLQYKFIEICLNFLIGEILFKLLLHNIYLWKVVEVFY